MIIISKNILPLPRGEKLKSLVISVIKNLKRASNTAGVDQLKEKKGRRKEK